MMLLSSWSRFVVSFSPSFSQTRVDIDDYYDAVNNLNNPNFPSETNSINENQLSILYNSDFNESLIVINETFSPSSNPTILTSLPTSESTSVNPSTYPTTHPSISPTVYPSETPSSYPSDYPSIFPTFEPSFYPSFDPSSVPTLLFNLQSSEQSKKQRNKTMLYLIIPFIFMVLVMIYWYHHYKKSQSFIATKIQSHSNSIIVTPIHAWNKVTSNKLEEYWKIDFRDDPYSHIDQRTNIDSTEYDTTKAINIGMSTFNFSTLHQHINKLTSHEMIPIADETP